MAQPSPSATALSSPLAIVGSQYCAPYPVDLSIVRKVMTLADGNFAVTDNNGNLMFKVKEKLLTWVHEKKTLLDPAGNPVITFRRKAMTLHSRWQVFRGQSTDEKDLIFTAKTHSAFYRKPKLDIFLANNTAEQVCDFRVEGSDIDRRCTVYAGDENTKTIVAQMHEKHSAQSTWLGKDIFMVNIYPNMDYAFIVALIVILDDIHREGESVEAAANAADAAANAAATVLSS